jgi:Holliday junction resolvasome RuvABC endonuclease subunit
MEEAPIQVPPRPVSIGIDPGMEMGIFVARRALPGVIPQYECLLHNTVKTSPADPMFGRLLCCYTVLAQVLGAHRPSRAYIEVPWRRARRTGKLSVYTRQGRNVAGIAQLCAVTGVAIVTVHASVVMPLIVEIPSPTGKLAKCWEKQKQHEAHLVYGLELNGHEAVAAMLALKGL